MPQHTVRLEVEVRITTTDEGEAGIDRYVGLSVADAAEVGWTPGLTKDQVLTDLARNAIYGRDDAGQDGYADLDRESIHCYPDVTDTLGVS